MFKKSDTPHLDAASKGHKVSIDAVRKLFGKDAEIHYSYDSDIWTITYPKG